MLEDGRGQPWWRNRWVIGLFLVGITLALYWKVRGYPFINFDDEDYVLDNAHVKAGLTWDTLRWSLTSVTAVNWHPLTWLSHAADCQLFGLDPRGPHTINLLLHALNALLLFLLLQAATRMTGRSLLVAALFAWHPFNVESVVWISERKNTLSTLFLFLSLLAYGWYARRPNWQRYAILAIVFALGLAAKSMLVTLPVVLLLIDYWPLRRAVGTGPAVALSLPQTTWRRLVLEKLPLLVLSGASAAVTIFAQRGGGALQSFQALPLGIRLETAARAYVLYILKMLWPFGLAVYYPNPFDLTLSQQVTAGDYLLVALGVVLLGGVSWLAWTQRGSRPYFAVGWFWYVITMLPVIGIVQVGAQAMADRYAYVPLIGLFVLVVWGLGEAGAGFGFRPRLLRGVGAAVLVLLCAATFRQISYWHSSYELWQHAREVTSNNYLAADKIAILLLRQKNRAAFDYYREAARIAPLDPVSHEVVAALRASEGHLPEAIQAYEIVIRGSHNPETIALAYSNSGMMYTMLGDYARARSAAQQAMRTAPQRIDQEIRDMSAGLSAAPDADGYFHLAMLLEQVGQLDAARTAGQKAVDLSPTSADARKFLDHLR
jgi:protein O-mannosyl-transferase